MYLSVDRVGYFWLSISLCSYALSEQEFPHFIIDQFLLCYETKMMAIGDHYNFCVGKSVMKFGN